MHIRTFSRLLITACAAATLALPGAAMAASYSHADATHDVQRYNLGTGSVIRADHNKRADITKVAITYTRHTLNTVIHVRSRSIGDSYLYGSQIRTSDHMKFSVNLVVSPTERSLELRDVKNVAIPCDGLSRSVSHKKGRLQVTVPSKCLGHPSWVRSSAAFGYTVRDHYQFADDGLRKRGLTEDPQFALTPKLKLRS